MATTDLTQRVAISNGTTLTEALNITNRTTTTRKIQNPHPSNYVTNGVARVIKLLTYYGGNINNNNIASEKYSISPNFVGLIECSGTKKGIWYLPFPNTSYAIKFYGPDEYDTNYFNHVYAVPAIMDSNYITGLRDYTSAVPQEWITAFVQYVSTVPANVAPKSSTNVPTTTTAKEYRTTQATQKYQFSFNFCGNLSGIIGKSGTFSFEYVFYSGVSPKPPIAIPNVVPKTLS